MSVFNFALDPLGYIGGKCADATVWVWTQLAKAVNATTQVDFTDPGFLKVYGLVFAASSVLVLILWLFAVLKRVVRGAPVGQAIGEAIGFLWLSVAAAAFTPAVLSLVMGAVEAVTKGLTGGLGADATRFLDGASSVYAHTGNVAGGPVILILGSVIGLVVAVIVWIELVIAGAALYVAAVFAPLVLAGLVDRSLWRHTSKWFGAVLGLALVKPVLVIVLGVAGALAADGTAAAGFSSVLQAVALMVLAVFASYAVYRVVPIAGDELGQLHTARKAASNAGPAAAIPGPAQVAQQSIRTHMSAPSKPASPPAAARHSTEHKAPPPPPPKPQPAPAPAAASTGGKSA